MLGAVELSLAGAAAMMAGAVNALAGGGSLVTFPALVALGVPPVVANVTNTVALCPGYLGGVWSQRRDLAGQRRRLALLLPAGAVGGIVGGLLLLATGAAVFRALVPVLILVATGLLALQAPVRRMLGRRHGARRGEAWAIGPVAIAAVYGGYFGAGLGVMMLAILGLLVEDTLTRLNATKQALSLAINVTAAAYFAVTAPVVWPATAVMAVGALVGGVIGGRLARWVDPGTLRWIVVGLGAVLGVAYGVRLVT